MEVPCELELILQLFEIKQYLPILILPPELIIVFAPILVPSPISIAPSLAATNLTFSSKTTLLLIIILPFSLILRVTFL